MLSASKKERSQDLDQEGTRRAKKRFGRLLKATKRADN